MTEYFLASERFDKLATGQSDSLEIYRRYGDDGEFNRSESSRVKKIDDTKAEIGGTTYDLQFKYIKVPKIDHRKPHPVVKRNWNDHVQRIKESIREQRSILEKYVSEDLKGIRSNLFVEPEYANVVETKINDLRKKLESLNLQVDKLKDYYEKLDKSDQ